MHPLLAQVAESRGQSDAAHWNACLSPEAALIAEAGRLVLAKVPPLLGHCALLSAAWSVVLRNQQSLPAIVVVGDLSVDNRVVFVASGNFPQCSDPGLIEDTSWEGHCWVDVGGYIGDISVFRTAYASPPQHHLSQFVSARFGPGRGLLLATAPQMAQMNLQYEPRYVLTDVQVQALIAGLQYQQTQLRQPFN
jgi:hypothetical protein